MRIYLAGSALAQQKLIGWRYALHTQEGFEVTARWLDNNNIKDAEDIANPDLAVQEEIRRMCKMDVEDILSAHAMIVCTETPSSTGGFHTEVGLACARDIPVICIPKQVNIFQVSMCYQADTLAQVVMWLKEVQESL